jgi:DNA-binding NtrC family response regulator
VDELTSAVPALKNVKLLVVDDNQANRRLLEAIFDSEGCEVSLAESGEDALPAVAAHRPDIVLLDLRMPGLDGIETLRNLRSTAPRLPILMLTAYGDHSAAIQASGYGADDFISRPISNDELVVRVAHAVEHRRLLDQMEALRNRVSEGEYLRRLMAPSVAMAAVVENIRRVAKSNLTVLITGETGTGKELVARALHQESDRSEMPFIAVDCGALPENIIESELFGYHKGAFTGADRPKPGYFDAAEGGTLFLDEVGNLPPATQIKLLRVIQERELRPLGTVQSSPVDVRVIAATNEKLDPSTPNARFRADLYYRLAEFSIAVPALKDRSEDLPMLARRFMEEAAQELRRPICNISPAALEALRAHSWPGNIRELRNVMRNAVVQCKGVVVEVDDVRLAMGITDTISATPSSNEGALSPPIPLRKVREQALAAVERKAIADALRFTNGNKAAAARLLEVDVKTLYAKLRQYAVDT